MFDKDRAELAVHRGAQSLLFRFSTAALFGFIGGMSAMISSHGLPGCDAADPGPGLPLFRRPQAASPQAAPPRKQPTSVALEVPPTPAGVTSEQTQGDEVDTAEVIRRGDRTVTAGRGPMDLDEVLMGDATAPPADDSHKWFVSVIVDDSKESQALLYDLKHSEYLRAWVNLEESKQSWSHTTVYVAKDQTQDWRWKNLKITRYPVLILQPPAKLRDEKKPDSWIYGDPKTVIWQFDGYDATSPNRAQLRSDAIRRALTLYVQAVASRRAREDYAGPRAKAAPPSTPGARQAATPGASQDAGAPPFTMPVFPQVPGSNPVTQTDPTFPVAPTAQTGAIGQILGLAQYAMGSGGFWVFVLVGLKIFELFAAKTPSKLDDQVAVIARSIADQVQNPIKIDPSK